MPAKKEHKINLLPQEEFAATTFGRILSWALGSFRIIVIITEMIVVIAFLSRFWLDAEASDLNDAIKQKKAIITSMAPVEKQLTDAQKRLAIFSAMTASDKPVSSLVAKITGALPSDVVLSNITLSESSIQIKGSSVSEQSIAQFIVNLKSLPDFSEATLVSADTNTDNTSQLDFNVKLIPKGGGTKKK